MEENVIVVLDEKDCWLKINKSASYIHIKWRGHVESRRYREVMLRINDLMKEHKIFWILNDDRDMMGLQQIDQKWAIDEWLPKALEAGYKGIAVIQTKEYFKKVPAEQIAASARFYFEGKIEVSYFRSIKEAETWIASFMKKKKV